jgi:hypothetical protein
MFVHLAQNRHNLPIDLRPMFVIGSNNVCKPEPLLVDRATVNTTDFLSVQLLRETPAVFERHYGRSPILSNPHKPRSTAI